MILTANLSLNKVEYGAAEDTYTTLYQANNNNSDIVDALMPSGVLALHHGGTALATVASGSVLVANALDTISALTSTSGTKMLVNTAGVLSFETVTGTGAPVLAGSPTFTTQISTPKVTASDANGLSLFEDGGFGIVIQDGGNPLVSRANDHTQVSIENSESSTAKYPGLIVDNYIGASAGHGVSAFRSAAGTKAIPTAMPVSITVGAFIWYAHDGTDFREIGRFQMVTGHNFAAGDREGDFLLKTVDGTTSTTRMIAYHDGIIYFNGLVGIGTATPSAKLAINGGLAVGEDADPGDNNLKVVGNVEIDGALNHDGTTVGLYGTIPVVQGAALTVQLTTITYTAPGTPDYALQDLVQNTGFGFVTKDEGNTVLSVIKNLQDRVAQLEARLGSSTGVGLFT